MDHTLIARVYSLVAEMEALKAEIEALKRTYPKDGDYLFKEKAAQLRGIANELQQLGH